MDRILALIGKIPGALMIVPLIAGALFNTFVPSALQVGSFTTALFKEGAPVLIGLFFFTMASQIRLRAAVPALEKGVVMLLAKYGIAVAIGVSVAYLTPNGTLWGLVPLAIIAAMSNSNGALYVTLTGQFGNKTDKGAISVLSLNDGPFLTMIALGAAGLAQFPFLALLAAVLPILLGFILGNTSEKARAFLAPGEKLVIPFAAFALGAGIDFRVLLASGPAGILLGVMTLVLSGGLAMLALYLWHTVKRHPKHTRNVIGGACESTTAGNAIATPAAIALIDPSYLTTQSVATSQVAAAVVTTALIGPFMVAAIAKWQRSRGVSVEAEDALYTQVKEKAPVPQAA